MCSSHWTLSNFKNVQISNIKLADFDLSREAEDKTNETKQSAVHVMMTTRAGGGTVLYMSPEVQRKERATSASDMYAATNPHHFSNYNNSCITTRKLTITSQCRTWYPIQSLQFPTRCQKFTTNWIQKYHDKNYS